MRNVRFIRHPSGAHKPTDLRDQQYVLANEGQPLTNVQLPSGAKLASSDNRFDLCAVEGLIVHRPRLDNLVAPSGFYEEHLPTLVPRSRKDQASVAATAGESLSGQALPSGALVPEAPKGYDWIATEFGFLRLQVVKAACRKGQQDPLHRREPE